MILEFKVWGSKEWYEQAVGLLERAGLVELPDMAWADPDSDGEKIGCYYDYRDDDGIPAEQLCSVLNKVRDVIMSGQMPEIEINIVASQEVATKPA